MSRTASLLVAALLASVSGVARAETASPDARSFAATPWFAYWSGTERVYDGELAVGSQRPLDRPTLLPRRDDQRFTSAYMRGAFSAVRGRESWRLAELGSQHELPRGVVLGTGFRVDQREASAKHLMVAATIPLKSAFLVPTLEAGERSPTAPVLLGGGEVRFRRDRPLGYTVGLEASRWTFDRARILAKAGAVARIGPRVLVEQRVGAGPWMGSGAGGELALQWISASVQSWNPRLATHERLTLGRGLRAPEGVQRPSDGSAFVDLALGGRYAIGAEAGLVVDAVYGAQPGSHTRAGIEVTFYDTLF